MKRTAVAGLCALMLGGAALAQEAPAAAQTEETETPATTPSGQLTARVVSASSDSLYLEGEHGAVIPVRVTHATRLSGKRLKKDERIEARLRQDFPQGKEVRASFEVLRHEDGKVENVATSVDPGR